MAFFEDFFFEQFPSLYKREDTNKDLDPLSQDRGTFERFLEIFGVEIDDEIIPEIENFLDNIDATTADSKFLNEIAYNLGNPPDLFAVEADYRNLLQFAVSIYKIKGTKQSYELFFAILGFTAILTEVPVIEVFRDQGHIRDETPVHIRDQFCKTCSDYDISFSSTAGPLLLDQTTLDRLREAIDFVEPINARLRSLIAGVAFEDAITYCGQENVNFNLIEVNKRDTGLTRDNLETRDDAITVPEPEIITQCTSVLIGIDYMVIETDFIVSP